MASPSAGAMDALRHLARYLKGTTNLTLSAPIASDQNEFTFWTDSDHCGNREPQNMCRSQLGFLAMINGAPFMWKSSAMSKQAPTSTMGTTPPAISVGEAETYAASNGIMEFMHISYIAEEMHMADFPSPMTISMDSTVAEAFMRNNCLKTKMKHIDVRQTWVQVMRDESVAVPQHVCSADNLADVFTKILLKHIFTKIRDIIMWSTVYKE
jgi:hypothetical protein